jgi:hypothetical protein
MSSVVMVLKASKAIVFLLAWVGLGGAAALPALSRAATPGDPDAPRIVGVTPPAAGTYTQRTSLEFEVRFSEPVIVVGAP